MREIKFRGWGFIESKGAYCMLDMQDLCFITMDADCLLIDALNGWDDDLILMQYTGLHDKNGVEIYEGDIVRAVCDEEESTYWVAWNPNDCSYPAFDLAGWRGEANGFSDALEGGHFTLEVIGNRHQHPEILEAR